ncbi:PEP-CTERM sorting domain-containing protein [Crocosphaera sp. UHCC 0190]|uniref:PEP-CTERM sorting domain-containing protein n=1 Tax=Crocosphaera sp. UHCC 0190 TaxID=3110246 RepID=UPI002B1FBDC5|nr:PEP-CTERM sorting domain-containing protein [Crocosphaera sp. UHCC 0190]MEA5510669.1 PEP-CTERM sorting domain-containing protein [Crocosphaera sp. UHCC 0190]
MNQHHLLQNLAIAGIIGMTIAQGNAQGAIFEDGDVIAGVGNGLIKVFDNRGSLKTILDTGFIGETTGMAFDANGNLYVTLFSGQQVVKFDPDGVLLGTFGSGYNANPESIVFDKSGNVYVGQAEGTRNILKFDSDGNLLTSFDPITGPRGTDWIDLAADQCTMRYTSEGTTIRAFDVCTNAQLPDFSTALSKSFAHRILQDGGELVADSITSTAKRLDREGNIVQTYTTPRTELLFALNLDPDGTSFWTASITSGNIFQFDIETGSILQSFNGGILGTRLTGLTIVGEITQGGGGPQSEPIPEPSAIVGFLALGAISGVSTLKRKLYQIRLSK